MTIPLTTRILVADDHPIVLRGLRMVLNAQPELEVVAEATDGGEAIERALAEDVQLAILGIAMPPMTGLQAAREITRRKPEMRVWMLSMHESEQYLFEATRSARRATCSRTPSTATSWRRAAPRCAASRSSIRARRSTASR
jgi:DNA-binding NarL/FixJ family response regulator